MSLIHKKGDLFTSDAEAIGHGVNVFGVMGAGIAVSVREKYPKTYEEYKIFCDRKLLVPGGFHVHHENGRWIYNLASQSYPGPSASYEWLDHSLRSAAIHMKQYAVKTIALPLIGCGIGGLEWHNVEIVLDKLAEDADINVEVWKYDV